MLKLIIVIFRECLELSLLFALIFTITKPLSQSRSYIVLGTLIGAISAACFALGARKITKYFSGLGDEIFDVSVILFTSFMIGWTVVWMQGYNRAVKRHLTEATENIHAGIASSFTIILLVASSVLREGIEIILFAYSVISANKISVADYLIGIGVGLLLGVITGYLIYCGLMKCTARYVFKVSTFLLIFVAAGLSAEAAGILTSSGILEFGSDQLWDSSWLVDNQSMLGKLLKIVIGYDAEPNLLQIIFYFVTIAMILLMIRLHFYFKIQDCDEKQQ